MNLKYLLTSIGLKRSDTIIFGLIFLTLSVLPCLYLFPDINPYDEKRIAQIVVLILVASAYAVKKFKQVWLTRKHGHVVSGRSKGVAYLPFAGVPIPILYGIVIFLSLGLLSTWVNGNFFFGFQLLSLYVLLFVFFLYVAMYYLENPSAATKAIFILIVSYVGLYALKFSIGYGMYLAGSYPLWPYKANVSTLFGWSNIRFFNHVQTWTLPLLISFILWMRNKSSFFSYVIFGLSAFWWCLIFASGAQGSTVAVICSAIMIFIIYRKKSIPWINQLLLTFLIGLVLYFVLFYLQGGGGSSVVDDSTKGRLVLWSLISEQIMIQPILGFGPLSLASYQNLPEMVHPHNAIFRIAYEFGIPATFIIIGMTGWGIIKWLDWNRRWVREERDNQRESYLRIGLSVSLCSGIAHSLVSGVMVTPLSQLWFCIIAGMTFGIYRKENKLVISGIKSRFPKKFSFIILSIVLLSGMYLGMVLWHDVPKLKQYRQYYIDNTKYLGYPPRFWQQGKIGWEGSHSSEDLNSSVD